MKKKIDFEPERCACCKQTLEYLIPIDPGTVKIVKQIARFIGKKGINAVHPRKEMEGTMLSSNEVGNLSRPRIHGLIAKIKGSPGNYCLTTKGAQFLHGESIPKLAIRSKAEHHTLGYYLPEVYQTTIKEAQNSDEFWAGINFQIVEGEIITNLNKNSL